MPEERYKRGLAKFREVQGEAGDEILKAIADVSPDFARMVVEFPYAEVFTRPHLDLKSREIAAVAALATLGSAQPQLRGHIEAALRAGCTREEIIEIIIQVAAFAGFPAALNALSTAKRAFAAADRKPQT